MVAFACFLVSLGLAELVVRLVPVLERFFQVGVAVCCTFLTMFAMAGVILYLGARRT